MNARIDFQTINGPDGRPAFVVVPYDQFVALYGRDERDLIPNEVAGMILRDGMTPARAWREHLGLTQAEVARRAGMSQAALSQIESGEHKPRKATREKLAKALGITVEQLA
ncbi:transcriptional regulator, y4mF family [Tepidimonas thermarum]|uniref:Transcriptional regulator, y4mF family n=1 Tax=Tepidimonas thermarum TaxID=335431 RepID=A0A554X1F1_9BURK|nr:helix-turn-helix domain-containing protein [Tepidimonas thermarum]TSE29645.1 transcriptional regulator, y4mF family [Tepidimonas thermarum]